MVVSKMLRLSVVLAVLLLAATYARADSKAEAKRYFVRGMGAIQAGQIQEGIRLLEVAYEILPHRNVLFNIGRAYTTLGDLDRAISYLTRFVEESPGKEEEVRNTLKELKVRRQLRQLVDEGLGSIRNSQYQEGIILLRRAYEVRPHPSILFNIAKAYEALGDNENAISNYRRYLSSNPKNAAKVQNSINRLSTSQRVARTNHSNPRRRSRNREEELEFQTKSASSEPVFAGDVTVEIDDDELAAITDVVMQRIEDSEILKPQSKEEAALAPFPVVDSEEQASVPAEGANAASASELISGVTDLGEARGDEAYQSVVVTASRRAQSPLDAPNPVTIISEEDIRLSGVRFIPDLLRRIPGFDIMATSVTDYNVAVRGFNTRLARRVLVLVDNQSIYNDIVGATSWSVLPIELADIKRIEVVRGPGSAIFGANAFTGVINIITKNPYDIKNRVNVDIGVGNRNVITGSAQIAQRIGAFGYRISAGYQQSDKFEIDFDADQANISSTIADESLSQEMYRANGLLEYYTSTDDAGRIYMGASIADASQEQFGSGAFRGTQHNGVDARIYGGLEAGLFTIRTFYSRIDRSITDQWFSVGTDAINSDAFGESFSVEPIFSPSFELLGRHNVVFGSEYRHKSVNWDLISERRIENHFAVYLQDEWKVASQLSLIYSGRLDLHPLVGPLGSPRVAAVFQPTERQAIRVSLGTAFRVPTMTESYLNFTPSLGGSPGAFVLIGGNEALEAEGIATLDLGYLLETDFGNFEAVVWGSRVTDLIVNGNISLVPLELSAEGDAFQLGTTTFENSPDDFIGVGSELSTRLFFVDGLDIGLSYSFQYIFDEETGDQLAGAPVHKVSIWSQLRTRIGLDASLAMNVVSGYDFPEPALDPDNQSTFIDVLFPIEAHISMQARVGYRTFDERLEFAISGTNLLDFGDDRHQEHPFTNALQARILGSITGRL